MDFIRDNFRRILFIIGLIVVMLYITGCSGVAQSFKEGYVEGHNATAPEESIIHCPENPEDSETKNSEEQSSEAQGEN